MKETKCSNCGKDMSYLIAYVREENLYHVKAEKQESGEFMLDWDKQGVVKGTESNIDYGCPHCRYIHIPSPNGYFREMRVIALLTENEAD